MNSPQASPPRKDINAVLREHSEELLALPGVVGVYVGQLKDKKTPCLRVMVVREQASLKRSLPRTLDGHAVRLEVTGAIRPMRF